MQEQKTWKGLLERLSEPFPASAVDWKPQATTRDGKKAMAVAYVETQPYQDRLDSLAPTWSDEYSLTLVPGQGTKAGKVFCTCRLTIRFLEQYEDGTDFYETVTRSDVGECDLDDDNAVTSAKAQAFKRTCAAFGMGRYLYDMPKQWVEYDSERKQITPAALAQLNAMIARKQSGQQQTGSQENPGRKPPLEGNGQAQGNGSQPGNGNGQRPQNGNGQADPSMCKVHNAQMSEKKRQDGTTYWLHILDNGDYCNGVEIRKPRQPQPQAA